ncbi:MAG: hypothetical protein ABI573_01565, partial [Chloroflexota bacterium]
DRLLVLGGGRKLLDVSIAGARAMHRVVEADGVATGAPGAGVAEGGRLVGRFPDSEGRLMALVEGEALPGQPATLEEVVMGHLAAGRTGVSLAGSGGLAA